MFPIRSILSEPSSRSQRSWLMLGLIAALALAPACNKADEQERQYCDQSGCYACRGERCYPIPGDPARPDPSKIVVCDNDSACGNGRVCNLGRCEQACTDDASCKTASTCIAGRCRPVGSALCGVNGALCTESGQCGEGRSCVARACAKSCTDDKGCAVGQVCQTGACVEDPAPRMAQCVFDYDCGQGIGGFRCINAYCLAICTSDAQCTGGSVCVKGTCRADRRATLGI